MLDSFVSGDSTALERADRRRFGGCCRERKLGQEREVIHRSVAEQWDESRSDLVEHIRWAVAPFFGAAGFPINTL